jgi:hypothetical protein
MLCTVVIVLLIQIVLLTFTSDAFQCIGSLSNKDVSVRTIATRLRMAKANDNNSDFMRYAKQSRSASVGDNVVELNRPLGLVLNEDENGNVFVETVAPKGNAARTGKVRTSCKIVIDFVVFMFVPHSTNLIPSTAMIKDP